MNLSQTQTQVITRGLQQGESVPKIAGKLSNHTKSDTELSDLIAMINKVKENWSEKDTPNDKPTETTPTGKVDNEATTSESNEKRNSTDNSDTDSSEVSKEAYEIDDDELSSEPPVIDIVDEET